MEMRMIKDFEKYLDGAGFKLGYYPNQLISIIVPDNQNDPYLISVVNRNLIP